MRRTNSQPIGDDAEWARGIVNRAWQSDVGSSDNELRFLMNMERGLDRFGARMFVSELQRRWLRDIERRLDRENADEETGGMTPVDEVLRYMVGNSNAEGGGRKRMWNFFRSERKGRRKSVEFVMAVRMSLPEARETVAHYDRVWAGDGLFGRDLKAKHFAIPVKR